jgi:hypothetical protein
MGRNGRERGEDGADDHISGKGRAKSLSFAVRSRDSEVASKKLNVFANWESVYAQ